MNKSLDYSQLFHLQGQVTNHKLDDLSKTYCSKKSNNVHHCCLVYKYYTCYTTIIPNNYFIYIVKTIPKKNYPKQPWKTTLIFQKNTYTP